MRLSDQDVALLQRAYKDLTNFEGDDPTAPIDPVSYRAPDGDRLIHIAALRGDIGTVELLLASGDDINAVGDMGQTPAHYAAMGKHRVLYDLLLQRGADQKATSEFGVAVASAWND